MPNIVTAFIREAERHPERQALIIPHHQQPLAHCPATEVLTYADLVTRASGYAASLRAEKVGVGDRVLLLMPVCADLYAAVTAVYSVGAAAVLIDPGMGVKRARLSLQSAKPKAMVSTARFLRFRFLLPELWKIPIKLSLNSSGWGVQKLLSRDAKGLNPIERVGTDPALITFTSGSTGAPKASNRHHGFLWAQHCALKRAYPPFAKQIDMTCFPVVVFHNLLCGVTSVLPDCDLSRPASVDALRVIEQINSRHVSSLSAAPAFWSALLSHEQSLESIRLAGVGGAPVSAELQQAMYQYLPHAKCYVVYGSTEAEPITHHHIQANGPTAPGVIAGQCVDGIELKIVELPAEVSPGIDLGEHQLDPGEVGEIVVAGAHVNEEYIDNPEANRLTKIRDHQHRLWHRTGDRGRWVNGVLWLLGRTKDVVVVDGVSVDPFPIEQAFLCQGFRVAFISAYGHPRLVVAGRLLPHHLAVFEALCQELGLQQVRRYSLFKLPVDGRHNSKLDRVRLRSMLRWRWWQFRRF